MNKIFRFLSLGLLLWLWGNCHSASSTEKKWTEAFHAGEAAYRNEDYAAAERHYGSIVNGGVENAAVYYNLGNAAFKQKRMGDAIYYWEKALQLNPGDREIQENLDFANLLLVDRMEAPADPLPVKFFKKVISLLSISQEWIILLVLFLMANSLFFLYMRLNNTRVAMRALLGCFTAGVLFLIVAGSLSWKMYQRAAVKEGIVIEQKADVRSGPGAENMTVFTIHEGLKVRVRQSGDGWYQISLPNGWNGWLPQNNLRIL